MPDHIHTINIIKFNSSFISKLHHLTPQKSKKLNHSETKYGTGLESVVYTAAKTVWDETVKNVDAAYQTAGVLVK